MKSLDKIWVRLVIMAVTAATIIGAGGYLIDDVTAPKGIVVSATFNKPGQMLSPRSSVKVRDVIVGKVVDKRLDDQGRAVVRFSISEDVKVPKNVVAAIETASAFGPKDINLTPLGDEVKGPFLAEGDHIAKTRDATDLQDLFQPAYDIVKAIDVGDITITVHEVTTAFTGMGGELERLGVDAEKLLRIAEHDVGHAEVFVHDVAEIFEAVGPAAATMTDIVRSGHEVLKVWNDNDDVVRAAFSSGSQIFEIFNDRMQRHGDALSAGLSAGAEAAAFAYSQLGVLPDLLDKFIEAMDTAKQLVRIRGPHNTLLASIQAYIPTETCTLFGDLPDLLPNPEICNFLENTLPKDEWGR